MEEVLAALLTLRAPRSASEYDLHALVAEALSGAGIAFCHEARLAPRRRADFLCGDICVEVKRGRPAAAPLLRQLAGYAAQGAVSGLILVAERAPKLPERVCGKPLRAIGLLRLWGVAL